MAGGVGTSSSQFAGRPGRTPPVESWTSTAADVDAWLEKAKPGDRFVYAKGPSLVHGAAAALVRKLQDAGEVSAHNRRDLVGGGLEFIIIRCRRRVQPMAPVIHPLMMKVLVELQADAEAGRRCRSDDDLGRATDLTAGQVKWQLKKLEAAKMITRRTVPAKGDLRFRVITVLATGMSTAEPAA